MAIVVFGSIVSVCSAMVVWFLKKRQSCIEEQAKKIDKIDKRTFRQSQAMEEMAAKQDAITNKYHPDADSNLGESVARLLRDENGAL